MKTKFGWIIVIVAAAIIVVGGMWIFWAPGGDNYSWNSEVNSPEAPRGNITHSVSMRGNVFFPSELTIRVGDTVVFTNEDEVSHWPASGIHPTHLLCPGFDSLKEVAKGETYSYTFEKPGTCPMHDHLMPRMNGKIIIE